MSRYVHVCTSHGVGLPALRKAASAEIFANAAEAQLAKGRIRPVTTNVSRYVTRRAPGLGRALQRILHAHRKALAAKARGLSLDKLAKDVGRQVNLIATLIESLNSDDLGLDLQDELAPAMLAAFRRAAAIGATQVGLSFDGITEQVDKAAVAYVERRGGELIKDLAGTTRNDMQALLSRAVEAGMSPDELSTAVEGLGAFSDYRADMIARTELAFAHVAGNVQGWRAAGDMVIGKRSILGDLHEVADECDDAVDAGVVGLDDEFLPGLKEPPYHPFCCLPGTVVAPAGRIAAQFARRFEGEVVEIRTAKCHLTVTPNHPVLTERGWVAAGELQVGDLVLETADPGTASRLIEPHDQNVPTRIEEIAGALLVAGGVSATGMPTTAEAFHGDGMPDGKVDAVWAAGALALHGQTSEEQRAMDSALSAGHAGGGTLPGQRSLGAFGRADLAASRGSVGSGCDLAAPLGCPLGAEQSLHLAELANSKPVALEDVAQGRAVATNTASQIDAGLSGDVTGVKPGNVGICEPALVGVGSARVTDGDAFTAQQALNDLVRDAHLMREAADRLTGLVSTAQITHLARRHFDGTVHNISTKYGWYFADGIAVHNCVCDVLPVLRNEDD